MKLLILTASKDTLSWKSLDKKLAAIKQAINTGKNVNATVEVKYLSTIPRIVDHRIETAWLEEVTKPFYKEYDIVAFHYSKKQRTAWGVEASLRGANPKAQDGMNSFYFWSDEATPRKDHEQFIQTFLHELSHEYHTGCKVADKTHEYHEKHDDITGLYKTFDWSKFQPRYTALKKQKNLLEAIVEALKARLVPKPASVMIHPVEKYRDLISQEYGRANQKFYPLTGHHIGTDYACPVGTPVKAPFDGEVTVSGTSPALGNFCHYKYTFEGVTYTERYLHLTSAPVKAKYKRGELIELSGKTGKITGPHLHHEIWYNDVRLDLLTAKNWQNLTINPTKHYV